MRNNRVVATTKRAGAPLLRLPTYRSNHHDTRDTAFSCGRYLAAGQDVSDYLIIRNAGHG